MSKEVTEGLKKLSRKTDVTLFMTLLGAFVTLLHRYTGQNDIVVGTDVANRNRIETEALIGFFVNQLVLRTDVSGDPSFLELLGRVREVALGAYAHQDLPFDKLVEILNPARKRDRTPLFQVKLILHNTPMPASATRELELSPIEAESCVARFDLTLSMIESKEGLIGGCEYNTDLFDATTITRVLNHFTALLEEIIVNPEQRLSSFRLLTEAESGGLTPSDFPEAEMSQMDFENLIKEITYKSRDLS